MKPVFKSQELLDAVVQAMENATVAKDRRGYCVAASA
jgi:hypothetical protein